MSDYLRILRGDIDPDEPPCEVCGVYRWSDAHEHIHQVVEASRERIAHRDATGEHPPGPHLHFEPRGADESR